MTDSCIHVPSDKKGLTGIMPQHKDTGAEKPEKRLPDVSRGNHAEWAALAGRQNRRAETLLQ